MASFLMKPMRLDEIRVKAHAVRRAFGYDADGYIDIVKVLESMQDKGIDIEIMPKHIMGNKHGQTFPMKNLIQIREDVYDNACRGCARDRMTIAHEIGHLILHSTDDISLARVSDGAIIPVYCDSEWQANAFAGELLAPHEYLKPLTVGQICKKYVVSASAAEIQRRR